MSVRIEIEGLQAFELLTTTEMTLAELHELKRISGMTPAKVDELRPEFDPDAWQGLLTVSYKRVVPAANETMWGEINLGQVLDGIGKAAEAALEEIAAEEEQRGKDEPAEASAES